MKTRKAVYAASLDPITYGHINVIERMAPLYDELVVTVAVDARKTYTFSGEERVEMARLALAQLPNVSVDMCVGGYVVKHAHSIGAEVIIRGLRNFKDLEDEQVLAEENRKICADIETVWVPCLPHLQFVSSSMVKAHVGIDPGWRTQVARSVPEVVVKKLYDKFTLGKARWHWMSLMQELGTPKGWENIFERLASSYSEPHRAYHTLAHIVNILDEFEDVRSLTANTVAVRFAIWYHDYVYDTSSKGNESESAKRAALDMRALGLDEELIVLVTSEYPAGLIMETKHIDRPTDPDAKLLVDLDLAILGKSVEEFDEYDRGIRKEYNWVPEAKFRAGRASILKSFLDHPSIYATDFFRTRYETSARKNLARSIEQLEK